MAGYKTSTLCISDEMLQFILDDVGELDLSPDPDASPDLWVLGRVDKGTYMSKRGA